MSESTAPDLGTDGPAAIARIIRHVTIAGRAAGSIKTVKTTVRRVICECQVDHLHVNGWLARDTTPAQGGLRYTAGLRFRSLWQSSARRARVTADLMGSLVRGRVGDTIGDAIAIGSDARSKVNAAIREMGQIQSAAVIAVCGEDESARGRREALCEGLDTLVALWELAGTKGRG